MDQAAKHLEIIGHYDPVRARHALAETAGTLSRVDRDQLQGDLDAQANQGEEVADISQLLLRCDDKPGVSRLLRQDSELAAVVREAAGQLVRFIPDARLTLDLLADPEDDSGEQLFLGVSSGLAEDDALQSLRRFDQGWWVQHVGRARGRLCIDLSDE